MHGAHTGEVFDLVAAGDAARDQDGTRLPARARPAAGGARRWRATRRSSRERSRTSPPCRSSRRRDRRRSRREYARAVLRRREQSHRLLMTVTVQQDRGRTRRYREIRRPDAVHELLEEHRRLARLDAPCARLSPRSSAGASSRTADRQLGSKNTIALAALGGRKQRLGVARREFPRLGEQPLRDERTAAADIRRQRGQAPGLLQHLHAGHADAGIVVVREGVVEDDRSACGELDAVRRSAAGAAHSRAKALGERRDVHAGGRRRASRPAIRSLIQRTGALRATMFESGANRLPQRERSWT